MRSPEANLHFSLKLNGIVAACFHRAPSPPRFLWGRRWRSRMRGIATFRSSTTATVCETRFRITARLSIILNAPSSAFGTFSPTEKRGGEGARYRRRSRKIGRAPSFWVTHGWSFCRANSRAHFSLNPSSSGRIFDASEGESSGPTISWTNTPSRTTTKGVFVRRATSRARCAARRSARGAACMPASGRCD